MQRGTWRSSEPSRCSFHLVPGGIRIVGRHRLRMLVCVGSNILFVNCAGFIDDEGHHTRGTVLDGVCDEGESCAHFSIDDVVLGAAPCMWSLASENPEHIAIERNMLANLIRWNILAR